MNEQEVNEAAERVRRVKAGVVPAIVYAIDDGMPVGNNDVQDRYAAKLLVRDNATLADAYLDILAAQRAADEEGKLPIDEAWLASLKLFTRGPVSGLYHLEPYGRIEVDFSVGPVVWFVFGVFAERVPLKEITTRAQLTALLAALQQTKGPA